jgi:predicted metallo-beta-lactamase superfamily hydrolase
MWGKVVPNMYLFTSEVEAALWNKKHVIGKRPEDRANTSQGQAAALGVGL